MTKTEMVADISKHNVVNNLRGVNAVYIRCGYGINLTIDEKLDKHVKLAEEAGIPYGFYYFSYAINAEEAKQEAQNMLKATANYKPKLPYVFDLENIPAQKRGSIKKERPNDWRLIAEAWIMQLCKAGLEHMLYCNSSDLIDHNLQNLHTLYWIAKWRTAKIPATASLHQYTDSFQVSGIQGNVDMSRTDNLNALLKKSDSSTTPNNPAQPGVERLCKVTSRMDYNGTVNAKWVLGATFSVKQKVGDRVVLCKYPGNSVTGAWHEDDVEYLS